MLTIVGRIKPDDLVVLELSSFQIEQLAQSRQGAAGGVTDQSYAESSWTAIRHSRITARPRSLSFSIKSWMRISRRFRFSTAKMRSAVSGLTKYQKDAGRVCVKFSADDVAGDIRSGFGLPGRAYLANLAGALAVAKRFGVTDEQIIDCLARL